MNPPPPHLNVIAVSLSLVKIRPFTKSLDDSAGDVDAKRYIFNRYLIFKSVTDNINYTTDQM